MGKANFFMDGGIIAESRINGLTENCRPYNSFLWWDGYPQPGAWISISGESARLRRMVLLTTLFYPLFSLTLSPLLLS
jgi:hypothetical protein